MINKLPKFKIILPTLFLFIMLSSLAKGQVLISLLLGDKLNSPNLEFGLDGGVNWLNQSNTPRAKQLFDWNLGFYFDFKLNQKLFIHTGVLVKSKMGASDLPVESYPLSDSSLNASFVGGSIDRKINYFNVPVLLRYRFVNFVHVEAGIMLGLRYTGYDFYLKSLNDKNDLKYSNDIKDNFTRLDAGGMFGLGYKMKNGQGMTLSGRYYYGFVDVNKVESGTQANSAIYICLSIPIGKDKAAKREPKKKEAEQNKQ